MFGSQKQPDLAKIRLPKAASAPRMPELQFMYNQAKTNIGREVELFWTEADVQKLYCMNARIEAGHNDPVWTLWEDENNEAKLVWRFETSDFDLINDVVNMLHKQSVASTGDGLPVAQPTNTTGQFAANNQSRSTGSFGGETGRNVNPFDQSRTNTFGNTATGQHAPFNQTQSQTSPSFNNPHSTGGNYQPGYFQQPNSPSVNNSGLYAAYTEPSRNPSATQSGMTAQQRPRTTGHVPPFAPAAKLDAENPYVAIAQPENTIQGNLADMPVAQILISIAQNRMTGKLEVLGEDSVGDVFFESGVAKHAGTPSEYGDGAIKELVTWEKGNYIFKPNVRTEMRSVQNRLEQMVQEGMVLLDQKRHLKKSGLHYESVLVRKHKHLSDTELKLMLSKGAPLDFQFQREMYNYLKHKRTFTDLLRDKPMDSTAWSTLLYNFLTCGLIEIKSPEDIRGSALDFLGDAHSHVKALAESFTREETGIYSFPALMFFMEYEFNRYEAYNFPMSLIVFEIQKRRTDNQMLDLLSPQAMSIAAMRIELVKRRLDVLGHFETVDFALLLPNTSASSAAFVANRIHDVLSATPLVHGLERENLAMSFGVASLPADGETLEALVYAAKTALTQAKLGSYPIVLSRTPKID